MIPISEFRIAPVNRTSLLVERLAFVPQGTYTIFLRELEGIQNNNISLKNPRDIEIAIQERFNEVRALPDLRKIHNFSINWFGKPTPETIKILQYLDSFSGGELVENKSFDIDICHDILISQNIQIPNDIKIHELGGIEWNYRLALEIENKIIQNYSR